MSEIIHTRVYPEPKVNRKEALRYAGVTKKTEELSGLLDKALSAILGSLSYKVCYGEFPISCEGERVDLGFTSVDSHSLSVCLSGCEKIVLFAATVGLAADRAVLRLGATSESLALMAQAVGAERIESLCDAFCLDLGEEYKALGYTLTPRFSPGYGDLPLALQRDIFAVLDPVKRIGLTLNSSLLMSPTKSVTAILGLKK